MDLEDHLFQAPCYRQVHLPLDQVAQCPVQPGLECFRKGAFTTSLGNLFQCLTTLTLKNVFLIPGLNLPCMGTVDSWPEPLIDHLR